MGNIGVRKNLFRLNKQKEGDYFVKNPEKRNNKCKYF